MNGFIQGDVIGIVFDAAAGNVIKVGKVDTPAPPTAYGEARDPKKVVGYFEATVTNPDGTRYDVPGRFIYADGSHSAPIPYEPPIFVATDDGVFEGDEADRIWREKTGMAPIKATPR